MNLISITPARNSRQVWLKFDEGLLLPLKIDDLMILSITKNESITPDRLALIKRYSLKYLLTEYSLRQVAISPKVKAILSPKIKKYCSKISLRFNYPVAIQSELISDVIQSLEEKGLLNPADYVSYYTKRHSKMSRTQISYVLRRLGINEIAVTDVGLSDPEKITQIITKKYSKVNFSEYKDRHKVYSALARRGFAINDIKTAIDDYSKIR